MQPQQGQIEAMFAQRVREVREKVGMSQVVLALKLTTRLGTKVDDSAITRLEKGSRGIRLGEAVAIASALDMTVDEMLRPALPITEQIQNAERHAQLTEWRAAEAQGEHAAARARLERLRANAERKQR